MTSTSDDEGARLIAAAADMYALLKLALGDTEHVLSQKFWDDARAAIARPKADNRP